jgi:hypothetical protein
MISRRARIDRLVAWSPVMLLGCLAALTYWLDAQVQTSDRRADGSSRHDPDLPSSATAVSFDARPRAADNAARAPAFPDDDSVGLAAPSFEMTDPSRPAWRSPPMPARSRATGNRHALRDVRATRDAVAATRATAPGGPLTLPAAADHARLRRDDVRDDRNRVGSSRRRNGARQQHAHDQVQVGRANLPTQLTAEVIPLPLAPLRVLRHAMAPHSSRSPRPHRAP